MGLDVHKDAISVAVAEPGRTAGRLVIKVVHDVSKLLKLLAKIGTPEQLHLVLEAGPTGFGLQRRTDRCGRAGSLDLSVQYRGYVPWPCPGGGGGAYRHLS
jgi:hypothetical protein